MERCPLIVLGVVCELVVEHFQTAVPQLVSEVTHRGKELDDSMLMGSDVGAFLIHLGHPDGIPVRFDRLEQVGLRVKLISEDHDQVADRHRRQTSRRMRGDSDGLLSEMLGSGVARGAKNLRAAGKISEFAKRLSCLQAKKKGRGRSLSLSAECSPKRTRDRSFPLGRRTHVSGNRRAAFIETDSVAVHSPHGTATHARLLSVCRQTVFGDVQTFNFLFARDPQQANHFQDEEEDKHRDKGPDADNGSRLDLNPDELCSG